MTPTEQAALPAVEEMWGKLWAHTARFINAIGFTETDKVLHRSKLFERRVRNELAPLYARIADLEAQLAAEASAVGELKQAYETAREMPCDANPFSGGRKSGYVRGLLDALDIVTNHRVAALVQAEGTQPNSTESEVRE